VPAPVAEVTTSPAAALAATLPPPPSPVPEASQSVASSATATVSSTAQGLPAAPANSATDEVSRTIDRLPVHAEPEASRTHSAEQRPAHAAAARVRAQRVELRAAANQARTLVEPFNGPVRRGLEASGSSLVGSVTSSAELTAASRSTAAPERPLPEQSPTSFPSGIASGASPAFLLLLLVLLIEGFAGAPPRLSRLLSLRRLAPVSFPFLLELERPD
jgi:hypothetical protein